MRKSRLLAWLAGFVFLTLTVVLHAEDKKPTTKEDRLSGTVHMIDKEAASIVVRKGVVPYKVIYNGETKFTIQNQPGSINDVIVGRRVLCLGTFNDKTQLLATQSFSWPHLRSSQ